MLVQTCPGSPTLEFMDLRLLGSLKSCCRTTGFVELNFRLVVEICSHRQKATAAFRLPAPTVEAEKLETQ